MDRHRRPQRAAAAASPPPPKTPAASSSSILLRDVSNYKTPKPQFPNPSSCSPSPIPIFFTASSKVMPPSSAAAFASRQRRSRRPSAAAAASSYRSKSAASRLKALELEQSRSSRKVQLWREKALMSFSRSLSSWLNFLFKNPSYCGCKVGVLSGGDKKDEPLVIKKRESFHGGGGGVGVGGRCGKRESFDGGGGGVGVGGRCGKRESFDGGGGGVGVGGRWRSPKRRKESSWMMAKENLGSQKLLAMLSSLKVSLKDVCSLEDMVERMKYYMSQRSCDEILFMMSQVCKSIDEGRLKMKAHCPVVTDLGVKERSIRTLMCYNPMWLRIGLYILFGGDSLLLNEEGQSNQDALFLKMTIESHLFSHTGVAKSYAHNKFVEGVYRPGYYEALGTIILKRILLLVVLLDKAKCESTLPISYGIDGLDGGSPLLFNHHSNIKSSQKVICEFLSEVMLGEGNLLAHLAVLGFKVNYEQFSLSEYDFNIKDLFEDLQDGILLSRAIQLLQNDASILSKLMAPCDTHKKKLHNCTIAMMYLKEAGVTLSDGDGISILGEDIVNGEKELTLSIIWNMFVGLQVPLLVERVSLVEEIDQQKPSNMDDLDYSSMTIEGLLLKWIQVVCGLHGVQVNSFSSLIDGEALCCLIHHYLNSDFHGLSQSMENMGEHKLHNKGIISHDAVVSPNLVSVQSLTTMMGNFPEILQLGGKLDDEAFFDERSMIALLAFLAWRLIPRNDLDETKFCFLTRSNRSSPAQQSALPGTSLLSPNNSKSWSQSMPKFASSPKTRRLQKYGTQEWAVRIIQSHVRGYFERKRFLKIKESTSVLQAVTRAWLTASLSRKHVVSTPDSFAHLSSGNSDRYLMFMTERYKFLHLKRSVQLIQGAVRTWIIRKHHKETVEGQTIAVIKLQSAWRGFVMRKFLLDCRYATIKIQSHWRCWCVRMNYLRIVIIITRMQALVRCQLCKKSLKHKIHAAVVIQRFTRGLLARNRLLGASSLQSGRLRLKLYNMTETRVLKHLEIKIVLDSVFRIQRWWKHALLRKLQIRSAIVFQSFIRGCSARKAANKLHQSISLIQRWWRYRLLSESRKRAVLIVQAHVRGWLARRAADRKKSSILQIQSYWKGYFARKDSIKQLLDMQCKLTISVVDDEYERRLVKRLVTAIGELNGFKSVSNIRHICATFSMGTEHSEKCCQALVAAGGIDVLLDQIRSLNRGIPDQEVLKHLLTTLRNIIRHPKLLEVLIGTPHSGEIIFQELLRNKSEGYIVACEILKKLCSNQKGLQAIRKLQGQLRRLSSLVQDLERKIELHKRNARVAAQRDFDIRRLHEAVKLLKLISEDQSYES